MLKNKIFYKIGKPRMAVNKDLYEVSIQLLSESEVENQFGQKEKLYKPLFGATLALKPDIVEAKSSRKLDSAIGTAIKDLQEKVCEAVKAASLFPF